MQSTIQNLSCVVFFVAIDLYKRPLLGSMIIWVLKLPHFCARMPPKEGSRSPVLACIALGVHANVQILRTRFI